MDDSAKKILLIEDDEITRRIVSRMLTDADYVVDLAVNGADAVRLAQSEDYVLLLMDIVMPVMDGKEATVRIRSGSGPNRHTPIVALTGSEYYHNRHICEISGMQDFITKPVDQEILLEKTALWIAAGLEC